MRERERERGSNCWTKDSQKDSVKAKNVFDVKGLL